jgi:hypothetical protein
MISQRPEVFWGFVASMYIGNLMLLILNLPLVGVFVTVLRLPQHILATLVLLLCLVGAFSLSNSFLDLWVLVIFGVFGYALRKLRVDPSPMVVALVLGPMMEKTLAPGTVPHAGQRGRSRGAPAGGDDPDPRRRRALRAAARYGFCVGGASRSRIPRTRSAIGLRPLSSQKSAALSLDSPGHIPGPSARGNYWQVSDGGERDHYEH